jgi:primosomal protein N'
MTASGKTKDDGRGRLTIHCPDCQMELAEHRGPGRILIACFTVEFRRRIWITCPRCNRKVGWNS